jgi:DNA-binding transcriptional MerR regulator
MSARAARPQGFDIDPGEPVYVIGVVSRLVRLPIWTLRLLDREGLVRPKRRTGRARLYSLEDLRRLTRIRQLCVEQGVNRRGVRVILRIEAASIRVSRP